MTGMMLVFVFVANTVRANEVNISRRSIDTLPQKIISKEALKHKIVSEHKIYCCTYCQTKYEIIRQGNKITIVSIYKEHKNTIH